MPVPSFSPEFLKVMARIANDVYNDSTPQPIRGWHRYGATTEVTADGYYGAVYIDSLTDPQRIIIAHRGTNDIHDFIQDYDILRGKAFSQLKNAMDFSSKMENEISRKFNCRNIYHTGHSLGAILAECAGLRSDGIITFENPGFKPIIQDYIPIAQPGLNDEGKKYLFDQICNWLKEYSFIIQSHVNMVNTCNEQTGNVYRLIHKPYKYDTSGMTGLFEPFEIAARWYHSLYYIKTYSLEQHGMDDIVECILSDNMPVPDISPVGFQSGYMDFLDTQRNITFWTLHFQQVYAKDAIAQKTYTQDEFMAKGIAAVNDAKKQAANGHSFLFNDLPLSIPRLNHDPRLWGKSLPARSAIGPGDDWEMVDSPTLPQPGSCLIL